MSAAKKLLSGKRRIAGATPVTSQDANHGAAQTIGQGTAPMTPPRANLTPPGQSQTAIQTPEAQTPTTPPVQQQVMTPPPMQAEPQQAAPQPVQPQAMQAQPIQTTVAPPPQAAIAAAKAAGFSDRAPVRRKRNVQLSTHITPDTDEQITYLVEFTGMRKNALLEKLIDKAYRTLQKNGEIHTFLHRDD